MNASAGAGRGWLPIVEPDRSEPDRDFIGALLREQQSLTAVEQFSREHEAAGLAPSAEAAQEPFYRRLMPATGPGPGQQFAFEVDLDACSGCKACVVACHTLNGLEEDETWRRVGTLVGEETIQHVTTACHHCEDPGCMKGCPVKAYVKDETTGIVRHLDDQCIGCKYCTMMCPYEVPQYSDRLGIVRKCDMCHQRLSVGEAPACVQSCPNEAIRIRVVDRDSWSQEAASGERSGASSVAVVPRLAPGAPDSSITRPTTAYLTKRLGVIDASIPQDHAVDPVAESHWPLAVMLVTTQAAVGVVFVERSAALAGMLAGDALETPATRTAALLVMVIAAVGLNIAPLHLGQPLKAWRVFLGLRTSWLSREAVIMGGFAGLLATATALLWLPVAAEQFPAYVPRGPRDWIPAGSAEILLTLSLPVGAAGFYASAMIYIATRRRLWRFQRTMIRFGGTAICLGLIGFAFAASLATTATGLVIGISLMALTATAGKLAFETKTHYGFDIGGDGVSDEDNRAGRLARGPLRHWLTGRRLAAVLSMLSLAAAILSSVGPQSAAVESSWSTTACLGVAFSVSLLGELAERLLYFATVVHDRMPGTLR